MLAVRTDPAAETVGPAGVSNQNLGEAKAVAMGVAMGDRILEPCQLGPTTSSPVSNSFSRS